MKVMWGTTQAMIYSTIVDFASATIMAPANSGYGPARGDTVAGYIGHSRRSEIKLVLTRNILRRLRLKHQADLITVTAEGG